MTPDLSAALLAPEYWLAVLITVTLVGAAVVVHYEALLRLNLWIPHAATPARLRILALIFGILAAHAAEIWVFGAGIYAVVQLPALGSVQGAGAFKLLDAVYLSATTFTTLGYGDLVPRGPMRLLVGSEALTGFVLITWSASFTYLEMQRYWRPRA